MSNAKITELTAATTVTDDDLMVIVDSPASSPTTKSVTFANARAAALDLLLTTRGDIAVKGASTTARLAVGAAKSYLTSDGTDVSWTGAGQIAFPATQNASSDPNTLDDYEEGTWTPTANVVTFASAGGTYTKIGRLIHAAFFCQMPATGDTNPCRIYGIPTNIASAGGLAIGYSDYGSAFYVRVDAGTPTYFGVYSLAGAALTNANLSGKYIIASGTYEAA